MEPKTEIRLFEEQKIRTSWEDASEEWYFSVVDVIEILTESANPRDYWFKMKQRVKLEDGIELSTICRQLKIVSSDGKKYLTDCANVQSLFRIIQSIPSPKAEPFKQLRQLNWKFYLQIHKAFFFAFREKKFIVFASIISILLTIKSFMPTRYLMVSVA